MIYTIPAQSGSNLYALGRTVGFYGTRPVAQQAFGGDIINPTSTDPDVTTSIKKIWDVLQLYGLLGAS